MSMETGSSLYLRICDIFRLVHAKLSVTNIIVYSGGYRKFLRGGGVGAGGGVPPPARSAEAKTYYREVADLRKHEFFLHNVHTKILTLKTQ